MREILLLVILLFYFSFALCQSEYKHNRITVFKDGTGFIEKSTIIDVKNNFVTLKTLPFATFEATLGDYDRYDSRTAQVAKRLILGTLKFSAPNNLIELVSLDSFISSPEKDTPYNSIKSLLEYNIGKKVKITYDDAQSPINGEIKKLVAERLALQNSDNYVDKVIIQAQNTLFVIEIGKINDIEFIDTPILTKALKEEPITSRAIHLKLNKNVKNQPINISYLQKGISWIPTYFIDIQENGKGTLKLEANLMNDIENIEQADFNFAVGVPSFQFSYVNSPLGTHQDVLQILSDLNNPPKESETRIENIMSQQGNYNRVNYNTNYMPRIEGFGEEDLFFYKKQSLSIKNGGRLIVPLFEIPFTYQDIYSVQINPNAQGNSQERYSSEEKKEKENAIWHSLKFKNTAGFPLTTGTVFFKKLNDSKIAVLSQNQFNYTPSNEFAIVEMTVSPDIWVQNNDNEIKREPVSHYKQLTIEGTIDIVNYKSKPITLQITRQIEGELLTSDKDWTVRAGYYDNKNKNSTVSWNLEVPAGKSEKIKYLYKILVY